MKARRTSKSKQRSNSRKVSRSLSLGWTDSLAIGFVLILVTHVCRPSVLLSSRQVTSELNDDAQTSKEIDFAEMFGVPSKVPKIIGGKTALKGRYTYPVALRSKTGSCGASLIAPDTLLTAAHCVTKQPGGACDISDARALIGTTNLVYRDRTFEFIGVKECLVHPQYYRNSFGLLEFDFALLKLSRPSNHVPVWLDSGDSELPRNVELTVMGWGLTSHLGRQISAQLMEVNTKYMSPGVCSKIWEGVSTDPHLCCWADSDQYESPYRGDSGGPLVVKSIGDRGYQDVQVGIVSMGAGKPHPKIPAIYARVSTAAEWIKENTEGVRFAKVQEAKRINGNANIPFTPIALGLGCGIVGFLLGVGSQELRYRRTPGAFA